VYKRQVMERPRLQYVPHSRPFKMENKSQF
jgi:hypothetical protein